MLGPGLQRSSKLKKLYKSCHLQRQNVSHTKTTFSQSACLVEDHRLNILSILEGLTLPDEERRRLVGLQLVSGMPAEVFMQTGSRTMMSYLLKPIADQLQRAFVER